MQKKGEGIIDNTGRKEKQKYKNPATLYALLSKARKFPCFP
jgi:hypothetical protein